MIVDGHMHLWHRIDGAIANDTPVRALSNGRICIGEGEFLGMPAWMLDCAARAEYAIAEFDAAGVDVGVVVQDYMDGEQNSYLLDVAKRWPGRFCMHALPDFWRTEHTFAQSKELLQCNYHGIKVPATHLVSKVALDDARLMPLWELMELRGIVAAIDLASDTGQAQELERVLQAYPLLKVALGHFGMPTRGGWPSQLELAQHTNVYLEMGGMIWLYRHEGYPFPGAVADVVQAKQHVGIDKLIWGSDFPRTMIDFTYKQSLDFIRTSTVLDDQEKQKLLGINAQRLYGLPNPQQERVPIVPITSL